MPARKTAPKPAKPAGKPKDSPDVQAAASPHAIPLQRVGVRQVRKPVTIHRPKQDPTGVVATFDLFVDLPASQKGTHMSRNLEALADVLDDEVVGREHAGLEDLALRLADRLLDKHDYANRAEVAVEADYFLTQRNPGGKPTVEVYKIQAGAEANRKGASKRRVGVQVIGMSACPCAMETVRHKLKAEGKKVPDDLPFITHNQRNKVTLSLELGPKQTVEAADLVAIAEGSLSAPTYEVLKRGDEGDLVLRAHLNPRFVEDVVREAIALTEKRFVKALKGAAIFASSEAEESIHKHNAYAERRGVLGAKP